MTEWRVLTSRVAFVWRSKIFSARLPKNFVALFEEDTLLFLLVGKFWLKAVNQVVCALRSLSIMGGIQNLIICVKMARSADLTGSDYGEEYSLNTL